MTVRTKCLPPHCLLCGFLGEKCRVAQRGERDGGASCQQTHFLANPLLLMRRPFAFFKGHVVLLGVGEGGEAGACDSVGRTAGAGGQCFNEGLCRSPGRFQEACWAPTPQSRTNAPSSRHRYGLLKGQAGGRAASGLSPLSPSQATRREITTA